MALNSLKLFSKFSSGLLIRNIYLIASTIFLLVAHDLYYLRNHTGEHGDPD